MRIRTGGADDAALPADDTAVRAADTQREGGELA